MSSPRAIRSASSALRATVTLIVTSTSGCSDTGTLCSPIVLIGVLSAIWARPTAKPFSIDQDGEIARRDRPVELAAFGRLAEHREALAVELLADLLRFALLLEVARLELDLHVLEARAVLLGGTQRLALGQEKIARKAVLDAHDVAHLAELGDAFEQDHFHCLYLHLVGIVCDWVHQVRKLGGPRLRATRTRMLKSGLGQAAGSTSPAPASRTRSWRRRRRRA